MPFNGGGTATPPGADFPAVALTLIQAAKFNNVINDVYSCLTDCVTRDGQSPFTANLPAGGFRITNLGAAVNPADAATLAQVQASISSYWGGVAGGTGNALTLTPSPALTFYAAGQVIYFRASAISSSGAATVNVSGLGAKAIQLSQLALTGSEIVANTYYALLYDGTQFQLLQGNTFVDSLFTLVDQANTTSRGRFDVSTVLPGQLRTGTFPDYDFRMGNLPAGIGPIPYAGASIPNGWLECDGSPILRANYTLLFAAIGTTWGAGDGSTTFNLPDMRGRVAIGAGTGTIAEVATASSGNGFTVASNSAKWLTGQQVVLSALSGFATTATAGPTYFVVRISATNIRLATTLVLAQNGTPDITISGSGSVTITGTLTARTLAEKGGEESHAMTSTELLAHTHPFQQQGGSGGGAATSVNNTSLNNFPQSLVTSSTGGNVAMNNMQPFAVTKFIISY